MCRRHNPAPGNCKDAIKMLESIEYVQANTSVRIALVSHSKKWFSTHSQHVSFEEHELICVARHHNRATEDIGAVLVEATEGSYSWAPVKTIVVVITSILQAHEQSPSSPCHDVVSFCSCDS